VLFGLYGLELQSGDCALRDTVGVAEGKLRAMVDMPPEEEEPLKGLRVLVVEDQAPIALQLEDMLVESECEVVGPASRVGQALRLLSENAVDAAVLDLNIAGELVYPVADALDARGLPFIFATGYNPSDISGRYGHRPVVQKPFSRRIFLEAFRATVRQS
jgi:CheY-like chemotaxis protein